MLEGSRNLPQKVHAVRMRQFRDYVDYDFKSKIGTDGVTLEKCIEQQILGNAKEKGKRKKKFPLGKTFYVDARQLHPQTASPVETLPGEWPAETPADPVFMEKCSAMHQHPPPREDFHMQLKLHLLLTDCEVCGFLQTLFETVRCHVSKDHRETFLVMMAFLKKHNADNQFEHRIRPFKKFIDTSMLQCLRVFKKTKSQDERHFFDKHTDSLSIIMNTDEVGMYINHKNMGPEMKALFADQILATYSATETGRRCSERSYSPWGSPSFGGTFRWR